jgi:hypothetical protein
MEFKKINDVGNGERPKTYEESEDSKKSFFNFFGKKQPKSTAVFIFQTILIFTVIAVALVNLSINTPGENTVLWVTLLSGSLGYSLPNPSIKNKVVVN